MALTHISESANKRAFYTVTEGALLKNGTDTLKLLGGVKTYSIGSLSGTGAMYALRCIRLLDYLRLTDGVEISPKASQMKGNAMMDWSRT